VSETLRGTLIDIKFQGRAYWSVAKLRCHEASNKGLIATITGNLVAVSEGDSLQLEGDWHDDPRYGQQFNFTSVEVVSPESAEGVIAWLSTVLPEVGRQRATEMVQHFGESIWYVIEHQPLELAEIAGITPLRAIEISTAYRKKKVERDVMVFLRRWHLTNYQAGLIVQQYGADTEEIIRENPYRLMEVHGFGFLTVDKIALRMGVEKGGIERARAGVLHVMSESKQAGHCYVPVDMVASKACKHLEVPRDVAGEAVSVLVEEGKLRESADERVVYLVGLWRAEVTVARRLRVLMGVE